MTEIQFITQTKTLIDGLKAFAPTTDWEMMPVNSILFRRFFYKYLNDKFIHEAKNTMRIWRMQKIFRKPMKI